MENPTYLALSNQLALRRQMETVANNIANANTTGFRAERLLFASYLTPKAGNPGVGGDGAAQVAFVEGIGTYRDLRPGNMVKTEAPLDVAIHGNGYFVVETPVGNRYTRDGNFRLDGQGRITNAEGFALLDQNGQAIRIPANAQNIEITRQGEVVADAQRLGRIQLVQFPDDQALRRLGGGLYAADVDPIPADARVETHQGLLEGSNVVSITELTTMLDITRRYESAQRIIDSEHERARRAIERLARVA
ncbi:MAG: flagellar basal-body rod protein FlgF [Azospirillum sp.]|nr:flagellar basal-body rod protein FlgF [Azospirillum sp.]MCZ8125312.1 flagellar basal-body rod protein FlgF [Magnetospirillum sp.]